MCGIAGVLGAPKAAQRVLDGLHNLEYRGYDSCGVAWLDTQLRSVRAVGGVDALRLDAPGHETIAFGHTRWATHGGVTQENAHPHLGCHATAAVVHNGVLRNHRRLRAELEATGHTFSSDTDTESLVHLWEDRDAADGIEHLRSLASHLDGTYSIAILDRDERAVYVAKDRNPLWVATDGDATWFASDPIALRGHVDNAIALEDGDHGRLTAGRIELYARDGTPTARDSHDIRDLDDRIDKAGYEHYMLKEIYETPGALNRIASTHVHLARPHIRVALPPGVPPRVLLLGAGTSYHACLLGAAWIQRLARLPADARPSPEYKDAPDAPEPDTLVMALSQSGETLDTIQALHRLRTHAHQTAAFTNAPKSAIARDADAVLALQCGLEVSVASTKTFLSQSLLLYLSALELAQRRHVLGDAGLSDAAVELKALPRAIQRTIHRAPELAEAARAMADHDHVFVLAKDLLLPVAMEGALKLKEIAYQHAEAYPAGELKHGPFALLTPSTPVLFLLGPDHHTPAVLNALSEVRARGAPTITLAPEGHIDAADVPGHVVWLPKTSAELAPLVFATALHLLSYWVAKARGLPIDRPRNLAKSVTVE